MSWCFSKNSAGSFTDMGSSATKISMFDSSMTDKSIGSSPLHSLLMAATPAVSLSRHKTTRP